MVHVARLQTRSVLFQILIDLNVMQYSDKHSNKHLHVQIAYRISIYICESLFGLPIGIEVFTVHNTTIYYHMRRTHM